MKSVKPPARPPDAYARRPRVVALEGEVRVSGPGPEASNTVEAARVLARDLDHAAGLADVRRLTARGAGGD